MRFHFSALRSLSKLMALVFHSIFKAIFTLRKRDGVFNPLSEPDFMDIVRTTNLRFDDSGPWFSGYKALHPRFELIDMFMRPLDGEARVVKRMDCGWQASAH
jgi:hypothetical protein